MTQTEQALVAEATGLGVAPSYAASETEFFVKVINVQLTFQRGPTGAVTGPGAAPRRQGHSPGRSSRSTASPFQSRRATICRRVSPTPTAKDAATPLTATSANFASGATGSGRASMDSITSTGGCST